MPNDTQSIQEAPLASSTDKSGETRLQHIKNVTTETAAGLIDDWRRALTNAVDQTERFTKDKPLVALAASFTAGVLLAEVIGALFRRRR
jgi:ElaB/YqjD/DUF883 family membrane-anchored ribosome-binding protein